jgi:uncharacterized protein DUF4446
MNLDPEVLSIVAVAAAGVALISLALAMRSSAKVRRLRRALRVIQAGRGGGTDVTLEDAEDVIRQLADVGKRVDDLELVARLAVQHVGLVKFDAFEDMGGHLSFAAAMLDAEGDGFVLTSINGRQETRIYAKPIARGASVSHLSDEEQEAIRRAISSHHRAG